MTIVAKQDTGFSDRVLNNKFQNHISTIPKDTKLSHKIQGTWELTGDYSLAFLNTKLKPKSKVVFIDSATSIMTGWGKITYNTLVKFYSTDHSSDLYEFYVSTNKRLSLTRVELLNNDLTYRKTPKLDTLSFAISFSNKDSLVLSDGTDSFTIKRQE